MPQIIVTADVPTDDGTAPVMFRERVTARDFESGHFADQLVERLNWAVGDAHAVDRRASERATDRHDAELAHGIRAERARSQNAERASDERADPGVTEAGDEPYESEDEDEATEKRLQRRSASVVTTAS